MTRDEAAAKRRSIRRRDGEGCCICGLPMAFSGDPFGPGIATLEHLRRRADGGSNRLRNLALAHRRCNEARGKLDCALDRWGESAGHAVLVSRGKGRPLRRRVWRMPAWPAMEEGR